MQTKNAIGNLINRYKAVLNKCNFFNKCSSILRTGLMATSLCVFCALSPVSNAHAAPLINGDFFSIEQAKVGTNYHTTFSVMENGNTINYGLMLQGGPGSTATYFDSTALINDFILKSNPDYTIVAGSGGVHDFTVNIGGKTFAYTIINPATSLARQAAFGGSINGGVFYGLNSATAGGAIANITTDAPSIVGDFINNASSGNGGAIHTLASNVGNIEGTFIGNTSESAGGAISSSSTIDSITGTFIGNSAQNNGGAFNNFHGKVGSVNGTFMANTGMNGGAIAIAGETNTVEGVFIGNTAQKWGGALFITGGFKADSIAGTFIDNSAIDGGGAFVSELGEIEAFNATFIGNKASNFGGAISNRGAIESLSGTFIGNTAVDGGALHHYAVTHYLSNVKIGVIDAHFINNSATGVNGKGGAIWTNRGLLFAANNKTNIFRGNTDSSGYNAIYVEDSRHDILVNLDFIMKGSGGFVLDDSIRSNSMEFYDVNISGESFASNVFQLNNSIYEASIVDINNATLRLGSTIQGGMLYTGGIGARMTNINSGSALDLDVGRGRVARIEGNMYFNSGTFLKATSGSLSNDNVYFAPSTLLTFNADTGNEAVLIGYGGALRVDGDAKLHLTSTAPTGKTIYIAHGYTDSASYVHGWSGHNLSYWTPSSLQRIIANPFDRVSGTFSASVIRNTPAGILREYPQLQGKTVAFLSGVDADVDSPYSSVRLLSRVTDERYVGRANPTLVTNTVEGLLQMGNLAGLNKSGLDVGLTVANSVQGRLSPSGIGTSKAKAPAVTMLKNLSMDQNAPKQDSSVTISSHVSGIQDGFALWLSPLYKHSSIRGYESGSFEHGRSTDIGGLSLGADYTFNEMFRLGLAFNLGAGYTRNQGDFADTTHDFDFWSVSLYSGFYKNNFALLADVGVSKVFGDMQQDVPISIGMSDLEASTESTVWTAGLRAEYAINTSVMDIIPHLGVRYMHVQTYDYDIKSNGTVATVDADAQGVWYFPVGVTFSKDFVSEYGWTFSPKVDVGFIWATGDMSANTVSSMPSVAGSTEFEMSNVDGFAFNGGVGFDLANDSGFSVGLNYNLLASEHETGHVLFANFKYEF